MTFYFIIVFLALISELISVISVFIFRKERLSIIWKPLLLFLFLSFLIDITSLILSLFEINNYFLLHIYGLIESATFTIIFYKLTNVKNRVLITLILSISIVLCLTEGLLYPFENNFWSNLFLKFILTFLSGYSIYKLLRNVYELINLNQYYFFFFLAIFISSLSFFYFSLFEELVRSNQIIYEYTWFVPIIITIVFNLVLIIPLWRKSIL